MIELSDLQVKRLEQIADLIRGDWSGGDFDGRDIKKWILLVLSGNTDMDDLFNELVKERGYE